MKLPKRIELWVLLGVTVAGLIFVFASRHPGDEPAEAGVAASSEDAPLKLHRCLIERDGSSARLDIDLRVQNAAAEPLLLQSPKARLLGAKGREIASFFLPFEQLPEIPGKSTQDVQLRYWLEAADLQGALNLDVEGRTVAVKTAKAFDLNSLKHGDKKTLNPGEW